MGRSWVEKANSGMIVTPWPAYEYPINTASQIYQKYSGLPLIDIMKHENDTRSISSLLFSGLPTVLAYHISDWVGFVTVDVLLDGNEKEDTPRKLWLKRAGQAV